MLGNIYSQKMAIGYIIKHFIAQKCTYTHVQGLVAWNLVFILLEFSVGNLVCVCSFEKPVAWYEN